MNEIPMLFPVEQAEFWKQMKAVIEDIMSERLSRQAPVKQAEFIPQKALLKAAEVCAIFQISKPTLYEWMKQNKLRSFKIKSRRYFTREDIETIIRQKASPESPFFG